MPLGGGHACTALGFFVRVGDILQFSKSLLVVFAFHVLLQSWVVYEVAGALDAVVLACAGQVFVNGLAEEFGGDFGLDVSVDLVNVAGVMLQLQGFVFGGPSLLLFGLRLPHYSYYLSLLTSGPGT